MSILKLNTITSTKKKIMVASYGIAIIFISLIIFYLINYLTKPRNLNVILITVDDLRQDHLGCYGYKRNTSPNIDKLAREGILFTQTICQGGWTANCLFSLITSTYPYTHGVLEWTDCLNRSLPTLASLLKSHGYYTELINGHSAANRLAEMGLVRGFDAWNDNKGEIKADKITDRAIKFLYENRNKKFFLWLHYFDPHGPYEPPPPYNKIYVDDNLYVTKKHIPVSTNNQKFLWSSAGKIPYNIQDKGITDVDYYIARYDGEIRFTDEQIGNLIRTIEELKLDKKSVIIFTADHGECLGEHDNFFMHGLLCDEILKVPLILKYPNALPANKIIKSQIGHIDIMPTLLSLLRIKTKIHMEGINLEPYILGFRNRFPERAIFSETSASIDNPYNIIIISLRLEGWKLIVYYLSEGVNRLLDLEKVYSEDIYSKKQIYKLYNLKKDPHELVNLVNVEKEQFSILKAKLKNWLSHQRLNKTPFSKPLDEKVRDLLKSLGYL